MKLSFISPVILITCCYSPIANAQTADPQDSMVLVNIYNNTNGANWSNKTGWLTGPVLQWYGISLNANGTVDSINLNSNNLVGTIPSSIVNLKAVSYLDMGDNQISGSIPSSIGNLINLNYLSINYNQLTGTIPSSMGNLTKLIQLYLDVNQLTGTIPSLGNLTNLTELFMATNQLTGSIPTGFGNFTKLINFDLSQNRLTGSIPSQLGNLVSADYFDLSYNQLSGSLPASLSNLTVARDIDLGHNNLSGVVPVSIVMFINNGLTDLDLSNNQLVGPFPFVATDGPTPFYMNIDSNKFNFDGIESVAENGNTGFAYTPQFPPMTVHYGLAGPNLLSVSAGGTVGNNTYYWFRDGVLAATSLGDSTFFAMDCEKYSVYVNNAYATQLTLFSDTLSLSVAPSVSIVGSANNICAGKNVTFTATPTNGGGAPSYQWQVNGNNVGTNSATYSSSTLVNNEQVTVVLTSSNTCATPSTATSNKITMLVTASTEPTFDAIGPLCQNATPPALPATSKEGIAGTWNPSSISTTTVGTKGYIFTPSGAQCAVPDTMNVTINTSSAAPTFDAIGPLCQNAVAPALPAKSKEGTAGTWSPATISTATVGSSNYVFTPSGGGSCSLPATVSITISPVVTPTFDAIGPLCQNATAPALPATSKEAIAGIWNPTTISTATLGSSNYVFTPSGGGSCSAPTTLSITISSSVTPTFDAIGPLCQNATAPALPATSKEGIAGTWSPSSISTTTVGTKGYIFSPTGSPCSVPDTMNITITATSVTPTFDAIGPLCQNATAPALPATSKEGIAGTWSPAVISTSTLGSSNYVFTPSGGGSCSAPATVSITISSSAAPTFDAIGPLCQNATAPALPATSKEGIAGTWSPGVISTATLGSSNYVFTPSGGGSCSAPATVSITISSSVTPTFDAIGPLCQNATAPALPATSKEGTAGTWSPAVISTATLGSSNYVFTPSGGGSCSLPATVSITVTTASQSTVTFDPIGPLCQNATAPALPATSKEGVGGTWSPAAINTSAGGTTTYTFTPSAGQCGVSTPVTVDVTVDPLPVVQLGSAQTISAGGMVTLMPTISGVSGSDISTYLWNPSSGLSNASIANPVAGPSATTTYTLEVTSTGGCEGSGSITINVQTGSTPPLEIPNVFSPNGDGINDTWVITNISYYPTAEVSVFNRYGQLVYQTEGVYKPWDGTYGSRNVPFGTYYYIINLNNNTKKISGSITILR